MKLIVQVLDIFQGASQVEVRNEEKILVTIPCFGYVNFNHLLRCNVVTYHLALYQHLGYSDYVVNSTLVVRMLDI